MVTPALLECRGVTAGYGRGAVIAGLDLDVAAGETVALLGPSGSGKTSLLYLVAGLKDPEAGEIHIGGMPVAEPGRSIPPEARRVAMVFQNYALWPHLSAVDTVAYPLRRRGVDAAAARREAARLLAALGIDDLAQRLPSELSGGQQQRVGIARALAGDPLVFLFDEPTAHLDSELRFALQRELIQRREDSGAAALFATHDAAEALAVADRVALLRRGRIGQVGSPSEVYERPHDAWSARLTGAADVVAADLVGAGDGTVDIEIGGVSLDIAGGSSAPPGPVSLVIRPEWAHLDGPLPGVVIRPWYTGAFHDVLLDTPLGTARVRVGDGPAPRRGERVTWGLRRCWLVAPAEE